MIKDIFLEEAKKQGFPEDFFNFNNKEDKKRLTHTRPTARVLTNFLQTGKMQGLPLFTINISPVSDNLSFPAKQGLVGRELIHVEQYLSANRKPMLTHAYKYHVFNLTKRMYESYIRDTKHLIDLTLANEGKLAQIWMLRKEQEELAEQNLYNITFDCIYPKISLLEKMFDEPELSQIHLNHYKSLLDIADARDLLR